MASFYVGPFLEFEVIPKPYYKNVLRRACVNKGCVRYLQHGYAVGGGSYCGFCGKELSEYDDHELVQDGISIDFETLGTLKAQQKMAFDVSQGKHYYFPPPVSKFDPRRDFGVVIDIQDINPAAEIKAMQRDYGEEIAELTKFYQLAPAMGWGIVSKVE